MSSHHIVRENQEPALVIANWQALDVEQIGQLLEWSPTVITDTPNLDYLLEQGIKVDLVFGNIPSVHQDSIQQKPLHTDFLTDALHHLIAIGATSANILVEALPAQLSLFAPQIGIVLFYRGRRYAYVSHTYEKWKAKGEYIYIDQAQLKSFQGLDYVDKGVFITIADGFFMVEFNTNQYILIGEDV